jgi:2,6-dihydroxypseudooxynicotine hydrolase
MKIGVSLGGYYALPELTRLAFQVRSKSASAAQARIMADVLTLAGRTQMLTAPLLIAAGKRDRLIPWQQAQRLAQEAAGPAELLLLEDGNHGCANVPYQHRPVSADWMARMLRA